MAVDEGGRPYDLATAAGDYPARDTPPEQTLLICSHMRSGSTLLGEALHGTGIFGNPLEYFHDGFRPILAQRWGTTDLQAYIQALFRHRTTPHGNFAVKLFWYDIEQLLTEASAAITSPHTGTGGGEDDATARYQAIFRLLAAHFPKPRYVRLLRRDRIAQAISWTLAGATAQWRQYDDRRARPAAADVTYDEILNNLFRIAQCDRHWDRFFVASGVEPITILYEELVADYDRGCRQLFSQLGHPDAPLTMPRLHRQSGDHSAVILRRFLEEHQRRSGAQPIA